MKEFIRLEKAFNVKEYEKLDLDYLGELYSPLLFLLDGELYVAGYHYFLFHEEEVLGIKDINDELEKLGEQMGLDPDDEEDRFVLLKEYMTKHYSDFGYEWEYFDEDDYTYPVVVKVLSSSFDLGPYEWDGSEAKNVIDFVEEQPYAHLFEVDWEKVRRGEYY